MKAVVDGVAVDHQGNISSTRLRKYIQRDLDRQRRERYIGCWVVNTVPMLKSYRKKRER